MRHRGYDASNDFERKAAHGIHTTSSRGSSEEDRDEPFVGRHQAFVHREPQGRRAEALVGRNAHRGRGPGFVVSRNSVFSGRVAFAVGGRRQQHRVGQQPQVVACESRVGRER